MVVGYKARTRLGRDSRPLEQVNQVLLELMSELAVFGPGNGPRVGPFQESGLNLRW